MRIRQRPDTSPAPHPRSRHRQAAAPPSRTAGAAGASLAALLTVPAADQHRDWRGDQSEPVDAAGRWVPLSARGADDAGAPGVTGRAVTRLGIADPLAVGIVVVTGAVGALV